MRLLLAVLFLLLPSLVCGSEPLTLEQRVERLEKAVFPTPKRIPLTVKNGQFYEGDKPFRDVSVNLVAEAAMATDSVLKVELDRIQACGCRFLRTLHIAVDDKAADKISAYQPTYAEARAGWKYIDRLVAETRTRGMFLCITLHHRQRLTLDEAKALGVDDTLFAPQPQAGEIRGTFLILPQLEKLVTDYCVELASRYKDEPHVVFIVANEVPRYTKYHILQRTVTSPVNKSYRDEWFRRFTLFQNELGIVDKEPTGLKSTRTYHYGMFQARNACEVFGRIIKAMRAAGVTQLIATTDGLGNVEMDVMPVVAYGDFVSWHTYGYCPRPDHNPPTKISIYPNPYVWNDERDLRSIARNTRCKGKPILLGEHANANEGAQQMLEGYIFGPRRAAEAGFDVSCLYCAFQGTPGWGKWTNAFDLQGMEPELTDARKDFLQSVVATRTYQELTMPQVFGDWVKVDGVWKDQPSPVVGCMKIDADGIELPAEVLKWGKE